MKVKIRTGNLLKEISKEKVSKVIESISTEKNKKTKDILKLMGVFMLYDGKDDDLVLHLLEIK
jgi:hypothetical protein